MAAKVKILEALADASAEDLAEIEAEIVKLEKRLASLKAAKSLVDVAINGKAKRDPVARKPRASQAGPGWPDKIVEYLRQHGPASVATIAASIGCSTATIYGAASKDRCVLRDGLLGLR